MSTPLLLVLALLGGDWQCQQNERGLWKCGAATPAVAPAPAPSPEPAQEPELAPAPEPGPAIAVEPVMPSLAPVASEVDGYIVQIGAYKTRAQADQAAAELDSDHLMIMPTRREEGDWYVLLLGTYPSFKDADDAGQVYLQASPGRSYWVRNAVELRGVLRQE